MKRISGKKIRNLKAFGLRGLRPKGNLVKPDNDFIPFKEEDIHQSIPARFEEQVNKYPGKIAVKTVTQTLTYDFLNRWSNRTAHTILALDSGSRIGKNNHMAALLFKQQAEMIVGIMGALKAGKIYLPLNSTYPQDRLIYMLKDSQSKMLITDNENFHLALDLKERVKKNLSIININRIEENVSWKDPTINIVPEHPAYVLYTSGSTGSPKGVVQSHRNVLHFARVYTNALHIDSLDKLTLLSSYSFDAAKMDIYGALLNGAALYPYDIVQQGSLRQLPVWLGQEAVTIYHSIPTVYRYFTDMLQETDQFPNLRFIVLGGEAVFKEDIEAYKKYFPDRCLFINGLGPTESTVTLQYFLNKNTPLNKEAVPVGYPADRTEVFLLDENNKEAPVYGSGEIVYKSDHLALGYLNKPEQSHELFTQYPLAGDGRVYWSGDLGRRLPDGSIEYISRKDSQVKINGYRIELGEIEAKLDKIHGIKKSAVECRQDQQGENYLIAYYINLPGREHEISAADLAKQLKQFLPEYMIPRSFIPLQAFPLTVTGKIDRKSLPEPDESFLFKANHTPPTNETEEKLIEIWKKVLKVQRLGTSDNFFSLGGHSIKAILLISEIHKEFNVKLPLKKIFSEPTIKGCADFINRAGKNIYESIRPVEKKDYYPLSSAQKRIFFLEQFENIGTTYNMPVVMKIEGEMDKKRFENNFLSLIIHHQALRTSFELVDNEPVQRIHEINDFQVQKFPTGRKHINQIIENFIRPFDLSTSPLLRVGLISLSETEKILLFDMHHIISDGTSKGIMIKEFLKLYNGEELYPLNIHYKDFTIWQNDLFKANEIKRQEKYWLNLYADGAEIPKLNLPLDFPRPPVMDFIGEHFRFKLDYEDTLLFKKLAMDNDTTLFMNLLAVFNVLLYKYTSQDDIIIGTPSSGRHHTGLQYLIGIFVNTLAIRNYPMGQKTYLEFLKEVKTACINAFENQDLQFEALIDQLNLERDLSRNPLFDVSFVFQNFDQPRLEVRGITFSPYDFTPGISKFDLTLFAWELDNEIHFTLEYSKLLRKETIERITNHYRLIIQRVKRDPGIRISEIEILTEEEKHLLIHDFNNTAANFPGDKTIVSLFEDQGEITPDNVAVIYENEHITYTGLNEKSNQLAQLLKGSGIKPGLIVAIMIERSIGMMVGIFGILKAGGAYLPIDPGFPGRRVEYMLKDSEAPLLVTTHSCPALEKTNFDKEIVYLDLEAGHAGNAGLDFSVAVSRSTLNRPPGKSRIQGVPGGMGSAVPSNIVYVIYTSGSTGKPKGVIVEHRGVINFLYGLFELYPLTESDHYLLKTPLSFDVSVSELFGGILSGSAVVLLKKDGEKDPQVITAAIARSRITHINFVPAMFNAFLDAFEPENTSQISSLKYIFLAGEELLPETVEKFRRFNIPIKLENLYGPTECTVYTSRYSLSHWEGTGRIPIGKSLPNVKQYILDAYGHLQGIGTPGELFISGLGLGRGYLDNQEFTAAKFIKNPFAKGDRMYRAGDYARYLPDGNIEFLGRKDHQIKIRGFRIELGEIENQLLRHKHISEAVVSSLGGEHSTHLLCAYIVSDKELQNAQLRDYLSEQLPDYMIPSYFMRLDHLPLTPGGKIDRKVLPKPGVGGRVEYTPPGSKIEKTLVDIWSEVLSMEKEAIGIDINFFEMGGHSLKAIAVVTRIHKKLDVRVPIAQIFRTPTIRKLTRYLKEAVKDKYTAIKQIEKKEYYVLSSAQKRLYILQQMEPGSTSYNMLYVVSLRENVNIDRLKRSFKKLISRHESLRTSFVIVNEKPVQKVHEAVEFKIEYYDMKEFEAKVEEGEGTGGLSPLSIPATGSLQPATALISSFIRPFDLEKAPLLRAMVIQSQEGKPLLLFDMHHIITDGTSQILLENEFISLYSGEELTPVKLQYKDYAQWQNNWKHQEVIKQQETYWLELYRGDLPVLNLPIDYPRPLLQSFAGSRIHFSLNENETKRLKDIARGCDATLYMIILAVFNILLAMLSGDEDIIVGTPTAGRQHPDLENIIGMFVNTLAMRNYPVGNKAVKEFLEEVKERTLEVYENQEYPFEELVEKISVNRDTSRNPVFDVMFNLLNQTDYSHPSDINIYTVVDKNRKNSHENITSKFDLNLAAVDLGETLYFSLEYCTKLFKRETIERFIKYFKRTAESVINNPGQQLSELEILASCRWQLQPVSAVPWIVLPLPTSFQSDQAAFSRILLPHWISFNTRVFS
ncbi:MAG: amino acid adenylation domain-containing protein [Candidatus Aminicenantes bacterium]|nr:MAG: amino acid adenylation domain-containing protein [Candidatus Aminicenantes bacterium]